MELKKYLEESVRGEHGIDVTVAFQKFKQSPEFGKIPIEKFYEVAKTFTPNIVEADLTPENLDPDFKPLMVKILVDDEMVRERRGLPMRFEQFMRDNILAHPAFTWQRWYFIVIDYFNRGAVESFKPLVETFENYYGYIAEFERRIFPKNKFDEKLVEYFNENGMDGVCDNFYDLVKYFPKTRAVVLGRSSEVVPLYLSKLTKIDLLGQMVVDMISDKKYAVFNIDGNFNHRLIGELCDKYLTVNDKIVEEGLLHVMRTYHYNENIGFFQFFADLWMYDRGKYREMVLFHLRNSVRNMSKASHFAAMREWKNRLLKKHAKNTTRQLAEESEKIYGDNSNKMFKHFTREGRNFIDVTFDEILDAI